MSRAQSSSVFQKTLREEVQNIFFQFTAVSGAGATQPLTTTKGESKGVKQVTSNGSGQYTIVLEDSIGPISNFLGRIIDIQTASTASPNIQYFTLVSATPSTRTIVVQGRISSGTVGGVTAGVKVNGQITLTTSPVI